MVRRVEIADTFYDSYILLDDSPETLEVVDALVHRAASHPEHAEILSGETRAIRSRSCGPYRALRLFYSFDGMVVRLLSIEPWDELE